MPACFLVTSLKITISLSISLDPSGISLPILDHFTFGLGLPDPLQFSVTSSPFLAARMDGVDDSIEGGAGISEI